jgi:hypothetical protein
MTDRDETTGRPAADRPPLEAWVVALADRLGVPSEDVDVRGLLDLARDAAHQVDRPAAPLTAFLVGYAAGLRGGGREAVAAASDETSELITGWVAEGDAPDS